MKKNLGPGEREARPTAVIRGVPPMSKAERLHRWAASLELRNSSHRRAAAGAFRRQNGKTTDRSPLSIALDDWAFQAEGLRSARWVDARAFFDLSEGEMRHVLGSPTHNGRRIPAAVAAQRIRALAERAEATAEPEDESPVAGSGIGPSLRNSRWFPAAAGYRRETEVAGSAS